MTIKTTIPPGGLKAHRFDQPSALREASRGGSKAQAMARSARARRLIRIDGNVEVLGDVADRLGVPIARLGQLYAEGCRTSDAIRDRQAGKGGSA